MRPQGKDEETADSESRQRSQVDGAVRGVRDAQAEWTLQVSLRADGRINSRIPEDNAFGCDAY